ncbi:MAG: hypothetical protein ACW986_18800 [Promethearchaeota archaeon]|jgi:hypothetical protein
MEINRIDANTRAFLIRKLLTICPVCKKRIFGRDIDILNIDTSKVNNWPLRYIHCHTNDNFPLHALTIYIDKNFTVRGNEVSNYIKIEDLK